MEKEFRKKKWGDERKLEKPIEDIEKGENNTVLSKKDINQIHLLQRQVKGLQKENNELDRKLDIVESFFQENKDIYQDFENYLTEVDRQDSQEINKDQGTEKRKGQAQDEVLKIQNRKAEEVDL
ncbi:hypothetical protein ACFPU1_16680 [Thalassorhabdus alkalitolerans]|uniref:DUF4200 domain-containing protein n=1 Tax=Thalassorhabdus alkalitolerans TaxID=2282697 RepID=A0ABW0YT76_9BACI